MAVTAGQVLADGARLTAGVVSAGLTDVLTAMVPLLDP
jgi:hypothetical protein